MMRVKGRREACRTCRTIPRPGRLRGPLWRALWRVWRCAGVMGAYALLALRGAAMAGAGGQNKKAPCLTRMALYYFGAGDLWRFGPTVAAHRSLRHRALPQFALAYGLWPLGHREGAQRGPYRNAPHIDVPERARCP